MKKYITNEIVLDVFPDALEAVQSDFLDDDLVEHLRTIRENSQGKADNSIEKVQCLITSMEEELGIDRFSVDDIFRDDIKVKSRILKNIHLFDILTPNCFYSKTEEGKAIIALLDMISYRLVLSSKCWDGKNSFSLSFVPCWEGRDMYVLKVLISGSWVKKGLDKWFKA